MVDPTRPRPSPRLLALLAPLFFSSCYGAELTPRDAAVEPRPKPIRLVEYLNQAEVRWGAEAGENPPAKLKAARVGRSAQPGRLARVRLSDTDGRAATKRWFFDDRLALLAPSGTSYRFPVQLPEEPFLQLGLGFVRSTEQPPSEVRFTVTVEVAEGESAVILDEALRVAAEGLWQDHELALERWRGQKVILEFETHAEEAGKNPIWAAWSAPEVLSEQGEKDNWDVILISLDTLRADHLGCYGYSRRPTSPWIDSLAARGVRFETAVSQSPWTKPAHQSLFNGLHPVAQQGLDSRPLATLLWRAGYRTLAITGGGQIHPRFGFNAGFETYRVEDWVRSPREVVERFQRGRGRRQFLFLHTYEIHDPYFHTTFTEDLPSGRVGDLFSKQNKDPHRLGTTPTDEERVYVKGLYDGGIAFVDDKLRQVFEELDQSGALERTIVVLTSDHGEQFWEHNRWGHGTSVYDHQLLVPLIIYLPPALRQQLTGDTNSGAASNQVIAQQVRLIDIYPTILDLLDIPLNHQVQGRSLKPFLLGESLEDVEAFAENTSMAVESKALRTNSLKFVYSYHKRLSLKEDEPSTVKTQLYDLRRDPGEQHNLAKERPDLTEALLQRMLQLIEGTGDEDLESPVPQDLDPKLREELEALGYVGE